MYPASEEGLVYPRNLWWIVRRSAVVMEWRREACLARVQAVVAVGVANQGLGVEALQNSGWGTPREWEVSGSPLVSHRPEVLWRSGPAWLLRDQ